MNRFIHRWIRENPYLQGDAKGELSKKKGGRKDRDKMGHTKKKGSGGPTAKFVAYATSRARQGEVNNASPYRKKDLDRSQGEKRGLLRGGVRGSR